MRELAILRHFYNLSRVQALELPLWEYQSLLEEYHRLDASKTLNQLYAVAGGFSGGEGLQSLEKNLRDRIEPQLPDYQENELPEDVTLEQLLGTFNLSIPTVSQAIK